MSMWRLLTSLAFLLVLSNLDVGPEKPAWGDKPSSRAVPAFVEQPPHHWPLQVDVHVLVGSEIHDRGNPVAFGAGAELLWGLRVGAFAELLASEGTPLLPVVIAGRNQPSLADRISVPFGLAARPFGYFALSADRKKGAGARFLARLFGGIGLQLGPTIEHIRTSDDNRTVGGLHAALSVDLPLWGGPAPSESGGVALRLYGRILATPEVHLEANQSVFEPLLSGQVYAGIVYYP